ncbi:caspase family protein [bacterium]|nr:caspase family protein [bacterium]
MKRLIIIASAGLVLSVSAQESRGLSKPGKIFFPVKRDTTEVQKAAEPVQASHMEQPSIPPDVPVKQDEATQPPPDPEFVNVDLNIPRLDAPNPDAIAVIIGNRDYTNPDVPDVEYASADAKTMRQYAVSMLGFSNENIIFIENAKKSDFELIFGNREVHQGKLYNWIKSGRSDVFVYYSGHGAPDLSSGKAYFMPVDSDPNYIRIGGYPLDVFYANLAKIPARSMTVVLDACFSGGSQSGMIIRQASPMFIEVEMPLLGGPGALLASSSGDQISSWYPKTGHSLFTYYFLLGLRGEADTDRDKRITLSEMSAFLGERVPYSARRLYGREQIPVVQGDPGKVLVAY